MSPRGSASGADSTHEAQQQRTPPPQRAWGGADGTTSLLPAEAAHWALEGIAWDPFDLARPARAHTHTHDATAPRDSAARVAALCAPAAARAAGPWRGGRTGAAGAG
jgi:hypothetical protein